MSNAVSALKGAFAQGFVRVSEKGPHGMITVRGKLSDAKIKAGVKAALAVAVPGQRKINAKNDVSVAWMSPDELLVLCPYDQADALVQTLQSKLSDQHALVAKVSDARALIEVSGVDVREVLAKLTPADVSETAFTVGDFRRSRLAQVAAAFWLQDEATLQIVCFRSVAQYVFDILKISGETGSEVEYF